MSDRSEKITVLITDDHAMVREGIKTYLTLHPEFEVVGEAASGEEAVVLAIELVPDVVLMDLVMPGIDGTEATRQIKRACPHTQVVVLTSYHDDEYVFPAIRAGALSYILKHISGSDMTDVIRRAANGDGYMSPQVATRVMEELNGEQMQALDPFNLLSDREMTVLQLVANGSSNAEISEELYITTKTVRAHMSNILSKLHVKDRTQAAVLAWRNGVVKDNG